MATWHQTLVGMRPSAGCSLSFYDFVWHTSTHKYTKPIPKPVKLSWILGLKLSFLNELNISTVPDLPQILNVRSEALGSSRVFLRHFHPPVGIEVDGQWRRSVNSIDEAVNQFFSTKPQILRAFLKLSQDFLRSQAGIYPCAKVSLCASPKYPLKNWNCYDSSAYTSSWLFQQTWSLYKHIQTIIGICKPDKSVSLISPSAAPSACWSLLALSFAASSNAAASPGCLKPLWMRWPTTSHTDSTKCHLRRQAMARTRDQLHDMTWCEPRHYFWQTTLEQKLAKSAEICRASGTWWTNDRLWPIRNRWLTWWTAWPTQSLLTL